MDVQRRHLRAELRTGDPDTAPEAALPGKGPDPISGSLPAALGSFMEFESAASVTMNFQPLLIPGLLQSEEYARAVLTRTHDSVTADRAATMVDVRVRRQELLSRSDPPSLYFVLDEAAVRREVAGPAVARRQIGRLIELAARPNVTIEVVPFSAGMHPGLLGPFVVHELPGANADVLYIERLGGCLISQEMPEQALAYRQRFERLRRMSLGRAGTVAFLRDIASL